MTRRASIDAVEEMKNLTIRANLKRMGELRARIWIAKCMLSLMAWILNCNIEFVESV